MSDVLVGTDDGLIGPHDLGDVRGPVLCLDRRNGALAAVTEGGRAVVMGEATLRLSGHKATCVAMGPPGVLIGTAEAHLLRAEAGTFELVSSFEDAPGRAKWYTPWGGPPDVRSIDARSRAVYVNVHVGGILASDDGTRSWRPTIDIDADVHQVVVEGDRLLVAAAVGLAVSEDSGETWTFETEGLHGSYCRALAVAGGTLLLSASEGPHAGRAAVYRRPLGSREPFERCTDWFQGNIDTFCLVAEGEMCAFATGAGEVFVSEDAGLHWERTAEGLPPVHCLLF